MRRNVSSNPIDFAEAQSFLDEVDAGRIKLTPKSANPVFGNWHFMASNGWEVVVFMDGDFDYVDSIFGLNGQSLLFHDIYRMDMFGVLEMSLDVPPSIASMGANAKGTL